MVDVIVANEYIIYLISLLVFLISLLICSRHFKKYGFLQGIFSTFCVPMIIHGLAKLFAYMFKTNSDLVLIFNNSVLCFDSLKAIFITLIEKIGIEWLTKDLWFYIIWGALFILTYGYSITWYKKHRKNKENNKKQEENKK